jgi:IS4 transposase
MDVTHKYCKKVVEKTIKGIGRRRINRFLNRLDVKKDNADFSVIDEQPVPKNRNILADQYILFAGFYTQKKCPQILRRIIVEDKETGDEIIFLTNHFEFGATTIAAIYKDRWQIELFFKALKQNLKIKSFVDTSENALYIQIWTAVTLFI